MFRLVFWICAEQRVDNIEIFLLLLNRACTTQSVSCFSSCHAGEEAGGADTGETGDLN